MKDGNVGCGYVLRNHDNIMLAGGLRCGNLSVLNGELMAAIVGIHAVETKFPSIKSLTVEGDNKHVINYLRMHYSNWPASSRKIVTGSFNDLRFTHVLREANRAADILSRNAFELKEKKSFLWTDHFPDELQNIHSDDLIKLFVRSAKNNN